jgi:hypothetical protein
VAWRCGGDGTGGCYRRLADRHYEGFAYPIGAAPVAVSMIAKGSTPFLGVKAFAIMNMNKCSIRVGLEGLYGRGTEGVFHDREGFNTL